MREGGERKELLFFVFIAAHSFLLTRGGRASSLRACLDAVLLPQSYQYPNLSEGADSVAGQLRGNKNCPFSGVTYSGRVWRKAPQSDARSVGLLSNGDEAPSESYSRPEIPRCCRGGVLFVRLCLGVVMRENGERHQDPGPWKQSARIQPPRPCVDYQQCTL